MYSSKKRSSISPLLLLLFTLSLTGLLATSCSDNSMSSNDMEVNDGSEDDMEDDGSAPPDTTFSNVQVILNNSCGGGSCHINRETNGVRLNSYDNVTSSSGTQYGKKVVQPGDPAGSPLVDKIKPSPDFGSRMPVGGPFLNSDQIGLIEAWIEQGAENN